jgi:hypothetical protein
VFEHVWRALKEMEGGSAMKAILTLQLHVQCLPDPDLREAKRITSLPASDGA